MTIDEIKNVFKENEHHIFGYNVVETEDGAKLSLHVFDREYCLPITHAQMREPSDVIKGFWMEVTHALFSELRLGVEMVESQKQTIDKETLDVQPSQQQPQNILPEPCESENLVGQHEALASL